ncbi:hypothetical protein [Chitinophaga pinensis]|uniref:Uncharacterized protein n=1 Tax=Chitinophaga pinensis (strain ATCC 43595 / DSM 2588 / LMG 13176 / NBRC 15968 / NCIMB 11800 / UQM 2034) TaxID=485918 RepID=A0A979G4J1_CHIPD|nr:hypothetical protein [Chitinophaga pinensis]ACU60705.1 hypothetical protein Cpin_3238 [Chitinophaga pinensis DSM 2588]
MNIYQFSAECRADVEELIHLLPGEYILSDYADEDLPDIEVLLITSYTLEEVKAIIKQVPEGHVMAETVQPATTYDGQRAYYRMDGEPITDLRQIIEILKYL